MNNLKAELLNSARARIQPGEQWVANGDIVLTTLLGSCVAACLYDPVNKVVGMNHFLLAHNRYPQNMKLIEAEAGKYGVHAMELLINAMLKSGAKKNLLKAKAFGGGNIFQSASGASNFFCVGDINSRFILEFLENENIPLVASDLGGEVGRIIHFFSRDFSVHVKKIRKTAAAEVISKERRFWKKTIKEHQAKGSEVVLWE